MKNILFSRFLLIVMFGITPFYAVEAEPLRISVLYFTNTSGTEVFTLRDH